MGDVISKLSCVKEFCKLGGGEKLVKLGVQEGFIGDSGGWGLGMIKIRVVGIQNGNHS